LNDKDDIDLEEKMGQSIDPQSIIFIGLGNMDRADDGLGLILVSKIKACFPEQAFLETEKAVEGIVLDNLNNEEVSAFIFIDAVDFGGEPGEIQLFDKHDADRFTPAFSTHKVPISLLMGLIRRNNKLSFLLGVQPFCIEFLGEVSLPVYKSIQKVEKSIMHLLQK